MEVRSYCEDDAAPLAQVFHRSIHGGASHKYTVRQVSAWASRVPKGPEWAARLQDAETVVACDGDTRLGFMTMTPKGYVDLAFVLPECMGKGVSDSLYAVLESRARAHGLTRLTTHASLLAEPFFARQGWQVTHPQEVEINGVVLKNVLMEKTLQPAA